MECVACHSPLIEDAAFCPRCGMRQPGAPETDATTDFVYSAFISYRHVPRDTEVATKVQKAIETYRFPKAAAEFSELVGEERRLRKAFRDEDELAAAPSLPESIKTALARSSALVVVCSSDTGSSHWVQEEIELFAALHGRDRIFPVLAGGASADVIPQMLQEHVVVGQDGEVRTEHASPFAADYRPNAANQEKTERMRLLAALADCPYDALRQRDRARKRSRIGLTTVAVVVLALVIGILTLYGQNQRQVALMNDSFRLAGESRELFAQGDRYGAIEKALEALPKSSSDKSRPLVPEAQEALEEAVIPTFDFSNQQVWSYAYRLATGSGIRAFIADEYHYWLGVYENDGTVKTYDLVTGREMATCVFPESDDEAADVKSTNTWCWLRAASDHLLVVDNERGVVALFDPYDGSFEWGYKLDHRVDAIALTPDEGSLYTVTYNPQNHYLGVFFTNLDNPDEVFVSEFNDCELDGEADYIECAVGERVGDLYVVGGDTIAYVDFAEDRIAKYAHLAHEKSGGLLYEDGVLVASSTRESEISEDETPCSFEAFDSELNPLWRHDETTFQEQITTGGGGIQGSTDAVARVYESVTEGETCVACSAGTKALIYALDDGEVVASEDYSHAVVFISVLEYPEEDALELGEPLYVTTCDGAVSIILPTGKGSDGFYAGMMGLISPKFSEPVLFGSLFPTENEMIMLGRPVYPNNALIALRSPRNPDDFNQELSFDELIAEANRVLEEAGRR